MAIPKRGKDSLFPQSHRAIALTSYLYKIAEANILNRLKELFALHILQEEQFGFNERVATAFQLFSVTEAIRNSLEVQKTMGAVFLDIERAFDTVLQQGLIHKMVSSGIDPGIINIAYFYLLRQTRRLDLLSQACCVFSCTFSPQLHKSIWRLTPTTRPFTRRREVRRSYVEGFKDNSKQSRIEDRG